MSPTAPTRWQHMTAIEQAAAVRAGSVSPVELVESALAALEEWQPVTNACSQLWPEEAIAAARERPGGAAGRPLEGVPVLVKESIDVAGHETTGCCEAFRGNVATR